VRTVAVKRAINTRAVELLPLAEARRQIEEGARQAVAAAKKPAPVRTGPYKVTMRFRDVTIPEVASAFREIERPAPDTLAFARDAMPDAYRLIRVLYRFINTD
jgi:D-amino peptidase